MGATDEEVIRERVAVEIRARRDAIVCPEHSTKTGATLTWLPVVDFVEERIKLGLSTSGRWVRGSAASAVEFAAGTPFFLPLLEAPLENVLNRVRDGLVAAGLPDSFAASLPVEQVTIDGLLSGSQHWTGLALQWAAELPRSEQLDAALRRVATEARTQKQRHAARGLIHRR